MRLCAIIQRKQIFYQNIQQRMGCANSQLAKFNSNAVQDSNMKVKESSNPSKIQKKEVGVSLTMTHHHRQSKTYNQLLKQEVRQNHNIYEKFLEIDIITGILNQGCKEPCDPKDQMETISIVQDFLCYCRNQYRGAFLLPTTFTQSYSEQLAQRWLKIRDHIFGQRQNLQRIQEDQNTEISINYEKKQISKKFQDINSVERLQGVWCALKKINNIEGKFKIKAFKQALHSGIYYHHTSEYDLADKMLSSAFTAFFDESFYPKATKASYEDKIWPISKQIIEYIVLNSMRVKKYNHAHQYLDIYQGIVNRQLGKNCREYSKLLELKGLVFIEQNKYEKALEAFKKSLHASIKGNCAESIYLSIGNFYNEQQKYPSALQNYAKSCKIYQLKKDNNMVDLITRKIVNVHLSQHNYEMAKEQSKCCFTIKDEINENKSLLSAEWYHIFGKIQQQSGNYKQAIVKYYKGLQIYQNHFGVKKHYQMSKFLYGIGFLFLEQGKAYEAYDELKASLRIYQQTKQKQQTDTLQVSNILRQIGRSHYLVGNNSRALQYYHSSLQIQQSIPKKDNFLMIKTLNYMAILQRDQQEYQSAVGLLNKSMQILQNSQQNRRLMAMIYNNIATVYHHQGLYLSALDYYARSLEADERVSLFRAQTLCNIGKVWSSRKGYSKAYKFTSFTMQDMLDMLQLFQAMPLSIKNKVTRQCKNIYQQLKMKQKYEQEKMNIRFCICRKYQIGQDHKLNLQSQ